MTISAAAGQRPYDETDADAARAALGPRLRRGDLTALVEYFALSGIRMEPAD